jgi:DNA repair exonuclease SbcCD nuclease subunit
LCRIAAASCRHVVIVAGNHDSPSFLNAPRTFSKRLMSTLSVVRLITWRKKYWFSAMISLIRN